MRVEHCEKGLYCNDNPYSHFGIVFDCVYFNACNEVLYIRSMQADFKGCNFGITSLNSFDIDSNSYISFSNCNALTFLESSSSVVESDWVIL